MNGYKPFGPDWLVITVVILALLLAAIAVAMWVMYAFGGRS